MTLPEGSVVARLAEQRRCILPGRSVHSRSEARATKFRLLSSRRAHEELREAVNSREFYDSRARDRWHAECIEG